MGGGFYAQEIDLVYFDLTGTDFSWSADHGSILLNGDLFATLSYNHPSSAMPTGITLHLVGSHDAADAAKLLATVAYAGVNDGVQHYLKVLLSEVIPVRYNGAIVNGYRNVENTVFIDTSATLPGSVPTLRLDPTTDDGGTVGDRVISHTNVHLLGTATPGATVGIFAEEAALLGTAVADSAGHFTFDTDIAALRNNYLTAYLTARELTADGGVSGGAAYPLTITAVTDPVPAPNYTSDFTIDGVGYSQFSGTPGFYVNRLIRGDGDGNLVVLVDGETFSTVPGNSGWGTSISTYSNLTDLVSLSGVSIGVHSFQVQAVDQFGRTSVLGPKTWFDYDPDILAPLPYHYGSEVLAADVHGTGITYDPTRAGVHYLAGAGDFMVFFAAAPGATVTLYEGDTVLGTAIANNYGGIASFLVSAGLAEGLHSFTATATAGGHTSGRSMPSTVLVDRTAPTLAAPQLQYSEAAHGETPLTISNIGLYASGTAEAYGTVYAYDDDTLLGSAAVQADGSYLLSLYNPLSAGLHSLRFTEADALGNVSAAVTQQVFVRDHIDAPTDVTFSVGTFDYYGQTVTGEIITGTTLPGAKVMADYNGGLSINISDVYADADGHFVLPILAGFFGETGQPSIGITVTDNIGTWSDEAFYSGLAGVTTQAALGGIVNAWQDTGRSATDRITRSDSISIAYLVPYSQVMELLDNGTVVDSNLAGLRYSSPGLGEGTHVLTGRVYDINVDHSRTLVATTDSVTVVVDRTAPSAPSIALAAGSDSGDGHTANTSRPTLVGTTEALAEVHIWDQATLLGSTIADSSGAWSFTPAAPMTLGGHTLFATATDLAGNVSGYGGNFRLTFSSAALVDTTPPAAPGLALAQDTGGDAHDGVTNDASLALTGIESGATVEYSLDGTHWGSTAPTPTEGANTIRARQVDAAGNTGSPSTIAFTLDTQAPATMAAPGLSAEADSGAAGDGITSVTAPGIVGSTEAGATVTLYDGASLIGTATADSDGHWSIAAPTLAEGNHSLTAIATDVAGNASAASAAFALAIDTTGPAIGFASAGGLTASASQTIRGTVSDAHLGSTITITEGATTRGTGTVASDGSFAVTVTLSGAGAHDFVAHTTDAAGNSGSSSTLRYVFDPTPPATPGKPALASGQDTGSSATDNLTRYATPTLTGTADAGTTVKLYDGARLLGSATADATTGAWSITSATLADGNHSLTVTATSEAGSTSAASTALAMRVDATAPNAPGGLAITPVPNAPFNPRLTTLPPPVVSGTAEALSLVQVYDNGSLLGSVQAAANGAWSLGIAKPGEGSHSVTATATDAAGNVSASATPYGFVIDTIAPNAPVVSVVVSSLGGVRQAVLHVETEAGAALTAKKAGVLVSSGTADGAGVADLSLGTLAAGTTTLAINARDAAGNTSTAASVKVTLEANGLLDTYVTGITGKAWTKLKLVWDTTGRLVEEDDYSASAILQRKVQYGADGTTTTSLYTSGKLATKVVQHADGAHEDYVYGITGQKWAAVETLYDAAGAAIGTKYLTTAGVTLWETAGNAIIGHADKLTLVSTTANEVLTGNGLGVTYRFDAHWGRDVVTDFGAGAASGHDFLAFGKAQFANAPAVLAAAVQVGADTVISYAGNSVTLQGIQKSALVAADFILL